MTGDEIRSEGPLHPGQTRDSIGPVLPDLLAWCGIRAVDRVHLRDTANGFDEVLAAATDCELLVVVGATGGGAADQLRDALDRLRARILVHRLRMRPGGSTVVAETDSATTILGLPGNPFAAVATLLALAPSVVAGRSGRTPTRKITGPLLNAAEISGPAPRMVPARTAPEGGWLGDEHPHRPSRKPSRPRRPRHRSPDAPDGAHVEFLPLPT